MNVLWRLFFLVLAGQLLWEGSFSQVTTPSTLGGWYDTLNFVFDWERLRIPPAALTPHPGNPAMQRAGALDLLCCGTNPSQVLKYDVVSNNLWQLFFRGEMFFEDFSGVKSRLRSRFQVNIDSLERVARGREPGFTVSTLDTVSSSVLRQFALRALGSFLFMLPASEVVMGTALAETLGVRHNLFNVPIAAFQTRISERGGSDFASLDSSRGLNNFGLVTNRIGFGTFGIAGVRNVPGGMTSEVFSVGEVIMRPRFAGPLHILQSQTLLADTLGAVDYPAWPHKTVWFTYDRADFNRSFELTVSDAAMCMRYVLRGLPAPLPSLGDMNTNGILDADDPYLILQRVISGGLGKSESNPPSTPHLVKSEETAGARGEIIAVIGDNGSTVLVSMSFSGDVGESRRFGAALNFDTTSLRLEEIRFEVPVIEAISAYEVQNGAVRFLEYPESFQAGRLVTVRFTKLSDDSAAVSLSPLVLNYFSFGESVQVRYLHGLVGNEMPVRFALHQNYPNPFNPVTTIRYDVPEAATVALTVYDILGGEVARLVEGEVPAGQYAVKFDGRGLASGVYYYRLHADKFVAVRKFIVLR